LRATVRQYDSVCRVAAEEFAILLPDCDTKGAYAASRRIGNALAENIGQRDACPRVRLAFGVASFPGNGKSPNVLFDAALPKEPFYDDREEMKAARQAAFSK
jgi:GGDEF domain-containing protein